MAIEKREVSIAKQIDDVAVLLVEVVKTVKNKEEVTGLVPEIIQAIEGVDAIDDEVGINRKVAIQTIGYRLGELVEAIIEPPKKQEQPSE